MMHNPRQYGWLFRFASRLLKYFLLGLFGLGMTCLLAAVLGAFPLVELLISGLGQYLLRTIVVIGCLMATAIVIESVR